MRNRLIAVAALLFAATPAHAQIANITMYGRLNLTLEYIEANRPNPDELRLSSNSSRLGLRGTESLGGGVRAIFQLESSVFGDSGGGNLAGRDSYVGLQAPWGTLKFGIMLTPYDDMHPTFGNNPTFVTSILSTSAIWAQGTVPKDFGGFDARLGNSIRYDTPDLAGFLGSIQVSLTENARTDAYVLSASGLYENGPFLGSIGFERNEDIRADGLDDWAFSVAAGWDFGVVRVAGVYERLSYETPTGPLKRDLYGVSATAPVGNGTLYAVWIHGTDGSGGGSRVGQLGSGSGTGVDQWEVSYTYPFSKRTIAYAGYVRLDNERNANYTFNINSYLPQFPPPLGMKLNGFVVGLVQFF